MGAQIRLELCSLGQQLGDNHAINAQHLLKYVAICVESLFCLS
jgi:hypothetical protein